jgi:aarF domain-containing kinase
VLLDFGLCIRLPTDFRLQYARFWQSLFLQDKDTMRSIAKEWGIGNEEMFASMQLMKPYSNKRPVHAH